MVLYGLSLNHLEHLFLLVRVCLLFDRGKKLDNIMMTITAIGDAKLKTFILRSEFYMGLHQDIFH